MRSGESYSTSLSANDAITQYGKIWGDNCNQIVTPSRLDFVCCSALRICHSPLRGHLLIGNDLPMQKRVLVVRTRLPLQETQEMRVRSLGREDPLEEGMATCSSIPAWTEEPGGLQSIGSQSRTPLGTHSTHTCRREARRSGRGRRWLLVPFK